MVDAGRQAHTTRSTSTGNRNGEHDGATVASSTLARANCRVATIIVLQCAARSRACTQRGDDYVARHEGDGHERAGQRAAGAAGAFTSANGACSRTATRASRRKDQMLVLVNRYVKSTVDALDLFAGGCHDRLDALSEDTRDLETLLVQVEAKLGMASAAAAPSAAAAAAAAAAPAEAPKPVKTPPAATAPAATAAPSAAKYLAMLKVGVPRQAVLNKMDADHVPQSLLPEL